MPVYNNNDFVKLVRPLPKYVQRDILQIPFIEIDELDISNLNNGKWLINLSNISKNDKNAANKIVHSFAFDNKLSQEYNNIYKFMEKTSNYLAVTSFDFSMDLKMDYPLIVSAIYNNRWSGAFLQAHGFKVIPTVGWLDDTTYDLCFSGLRDGGVFIISTLGTHNDLSYKIFIDGYHELRKRFPNTKIICVGEKHAEMDEDICYISFKDSFGNWDKYQDFWQPKLNNWDNSLNLGGDSNVV